MARLDLVGTLTPVYNLAGTLTNTGNLSGTLSFTGIQYLDDLLDVDISMPTSGDVLMYDGSKWVNAAGGGGTDNYNDLNNKPSINSVVLQGDRTTQDLGISYNDLTDLPVIPAAQVNADWDAVSGVEEILNKPTLSTVATTGSYTDLTDKPTIPAAQVNSDWNAVSGVAQILNKPTIPAAQVNSDWNAVSGVEEILNKPTLSTVATTGSYTDLTDKPTIPAAQVNSDWNAVSGVEEILNKPTIPTNLNDMSDVTISNPASSEGLIYDGTKWTNTTIPSGVTTLAALSDVDVTGHQSGEVLTYSTALSKWTSQPKYFYSTINRRVGTITISGVNKAVYQKSVFKSTPISIAAGNTSAAGAWTSVDTGWTNTTYILDFEAWSSSGVSKTYWGHFTAQWNSDNQDIRVLNLRSVAASIDGFRITYYLD